uniref:F-box domain-containing protein n=1 Tax=Ascaris lumbricoides TaxID=6252 RepID=A0A9J2Q2T4_ASCLU
MGELKVFIKNVLPQNVEHLVLYDESHCLSLKAEEELKGFKLKVHFCVNYDIIVDSFWMNGRSELITQTIWSKPYHPYAVAQPTLPEWYCVISELMDTAISSEASRNASTSRSAGIGSTDRRRGLRTASPQHSHSLIEVMFNLLSDDVTRRIYGHLEVKERGRLGSVSRSFRRLFQTVSLLCTSFNVLFKQWDDVLYCSVRNDGVSLAVENFVFEAGKSENISSPGVTVTSAALEALSLKYARTLDTLCLIGSLMHTHDIDIYFNALNHFEKLLSLTIPPSLYSVSTTNKTLFTTNYPSLRDLHSLRTVAAFVSRPDFDELKRPTSGSRTSHIIHFCDDEEIIVDTFWTNDKSELITKSLWKPPYKPYTVFQPTLPEWYCLISELMDEASSIELIDHETSLPSVQPNSNTTVVIDDVAHTQNVFDDVMTKTNLNTAHELESKIERSHATNEMLVTAANIQIFVFMLYSNIYRSNNYFKDLDDVAHTQNVFDDVMTKTNLNTAHELESKIERSHATNEMLVTAANIQIFVFMLYSNIYSINDFRRTARSEMNAISTTISDEHRSTNSSTV